MEPCDKPENFVQKIPEGLQNPNKPQDSGQMQDPKIDALVQNHRGPALSAAKRIFDRQDVLAHVGAPEDVSAIEMSMEKIHGFSELEASDPEEQRANALALFEYLFPNPDEREPNELIQARWEDMAKIGSDPEVQKRYGNSRFHSIIAKDKDNRPVAYSQFSIMPLETRRATLMFLQYTGIADSKFMKERHGVSRDYRGEGTYYALDAIRRLIGSEDAAKMGFENGNLGGIFESEMLGQGETEDDIQFTEARLAIHNRMGARAIMLEMEDGSLVSPHIQPRLSEDSDPIQLLIMYRPSNYRKEDVGKVEEIDKSLAQDFMETFLDNFIREDFAKENVDDARRITAEKFARAKRVLLVPPGKLPDITELAKADPGLRAQVERDYGDPAEHSEAIKAALAGKQSPDATELGM